MAFLDNSGDIILDAVLTDTGRLRLAQGDGSFKISKFALGDDEINYGLYDGTHSSGSAYYDLEVLQTPVFEAFTNNTSNLNSKLMSISRTNILYMPVLKLNKNIGGVGQANKSMTFAREGTGGITTAKSDKKFYVAVDRDTYELIANERESGGSTNKSTLTKMEGLIQGYPNSTILDFIRADQGLDTNAIAPDVGMDSDLQETGFIIELDYRLARVKQHTNDTQAAVNFIDDDNIASYYLTQTPYVNEGGDLSTANVNGDYTKTALDSNNNFQAFEGPRGAHLRFRVHASQELRSSTYLFTQIGTSQTANASGNILGFPTSTTDGSIQGKTIYYIDSLVRVVGANTGFRLDIPVRYVKIQ